MYFCPECDKGPFSPQDWWDHFQTHNTPWLQSRDPENLERTDLGYGEDLKTTTVPTHNLPNEPGFEPSKFGWREAAELADRDEVWQMYPHANDYEEVHEGSQPFMYDPAADELYMGDEGQGHWDIYGQATKWGNDPYNMIWGRYFPHHNKVDIFENEGNTADGQKALNHITRKFGAQVIPQAHRMVWLSQPNNSRLKYWHHSPTNTTYAWDADAGHHWQAWNHLEASKQVHGPNDWDGGFYMQNEYGKHPADLWGLPSQVDYAPINADGDYGLF